ncbi:MAG: GAF domain-containing sensor histidine kinase [Anaerolineales bacterium]|nr:GAF domain-containing sensor histidine kinase [Anaerolineales bacterium]
MERQKFVTLDPKNTESESDVRALHKATLSLFADLSLDGVLRRITDAAKELVNAQYAALGIPGDTGNLDIFITSGLSDEDIRKIPHPPVGKGLIGEIISTGESIRIPEISDHPNTSGFPAGHPEMHSFLGVPISAYGRSIGQIYLTNKENALSFSEHDQRMIEMLAAHAAAAIENARLYRQVLESEGELSKRNEQLELINHLTGAISSAMDLEEMMSVMLNRIVNLFGAASGEVFLREEGENAYSLTVHCCHKEQSIWQQKSFNLGEGFIGSVAESSQLSWSTELVDEAKYFEEGVLEMGFGTIVGVPIPARGNVVGVLSMLFLGDRTISDREEGLLEAVGAAVGVGVENARLNRQTRRMAVLEERERIGMDLHDGIIQSIYAVGLTLDSIRVMVSDNPDEAVHHIENAISSLNANIRDIRAYILDLQPSRLLGKDFEDGLARLSREFKANSLIDIDLHIEQEALKDLPGETSQTLLHISQEALANIAKHAKASRVWLSVRNIDDYVYLQIIDNGQGFDLNRQPDLLGHGLSNMEQRARQMGGEFEIVTSPGEGTTITIRLQE